MMSGKMSGRGEGSFSNAWSRGRPVMSSFDSNNSSSNNNNNSVNRGPPPGMTRGRGFSGNNGNSNNGGKYGGRDYNNFNNGGNNNNNNGGGRYGSAPSSGNSVQSAHSANNDVSSNPALYNRERYLHLLLTMVGHTVSVTKTNGDVVEGIFHTFCPFEKQREQVKNVYVIKGCRMVKRGNGNAAAAGGGGEFQEGSTVLISSSHVARLHIKSLRLDNRPSNHNQEGDMFRTDAEISGQRGGTERLVAAGSVWTTGGDGGGLGDGGLAMGGLESGVAAMGVSGRGGMFKSGGVASAGAGGGGLGSNVNDWRSDKGPTNSSSQGLQGTIGDWDQFSANEKRFNVKATFDENLYTTALDYRNIDSNQVAEAERIAKEIESTASTNIHIMEERNQKISADYDEEDLYSGVLKKNEVSKDDVGGIGAKAPVVAEKKKMNYAAAAGATKKTTAVPVTDAPAATSVTAEKDDDQAQSSEPNAATAESIDSAEEEKKGDTDEAQADKTERQKEEAQDAKSEEGKEPPKPKLNPNAKEFTFNPAAKSFTPSFASTTPAPVAAAPIVPEAVPSHNPMEYHAGAAGAMHPMMAGGNYGMGGMQYMQHGGPGMMPIMNAQHPQMRQPYTPYGGGPGQPMQPPQQPAQGHEDSSSVATGEGSSVPSEVQQHPQQPQYMPGYIPPGPYPGYYGGAAAMLHHHPHQRPGFHPPPQMQVMPGAAYQRMYPGMMQPMRGPPPYGYGPGGAPVPYPNAGLYPGHNGEEGHKFTRKNSKGGGNGGGGYKNKQRNSYTGRGGGNGNGGRGGYQGSYSEGRQSDDGSPTNQEGEVQEQQSEGAEDAAATIADIVT